jgi:hypothetical protein
VHDIASVLNDLIQGKLPAMTADFSTDAALQSRTAERMTGALAAVLDQVAGTVAPAGVAMGHDRPAA